jgi:hypothetical protein
MDFGSKIFLSQGYLLHGFFLRQSSYSFWLIFYLKDIQKARRPHPPNSILNRLRRNLARFDKNTHSVVSVPLENHLRTCIS